VLTPRVPAGGLAPQWGQAFFGEAPIWCCTLAMIAFTATLQTRVAWIGLGAAVVVWFAQQGVRAARRKRAQKS
jgi:hypothetical protein